MALREHCDQCNDVIPIGMPTMHKIVLAKAGLHPEKHLHVNVTHLLQTTHEKAHICPKCSIANLQVVIAAYQQLVPKTDVAPAKEEKKSGKNS